MTLTTNAALSKDKRTAEKRPSFEHRHFAVVAAAIAGLRPEIRNEVAAHFVKELSSTNARFNGKRFWDAAGAT